MTYGSMIVRIQLGTGRRIRREGGKNRHLAFACGALLVPASLMAYVLGFWRLASDMEIVSPPGISGVFSHWQVAIATAVFLHLVSSILNRYGKHGEFHVPKVLRPSIMPLRPHLRESLRRRAQSG